MSCTNFAAIKVVVVDIVITYVDGLDPAWQREYEQYTHEPVLEKRFRDWGTLPYLFRGIAVNMPFIRKVHLVVARDSQVPQWINRNEVNIVLHRDIIPQEYLPTFNSTAIEMFLHRIEGLDEEFLYFNDDMYPMMECRAEDFFREGRGVIGMSSHFWPSNMYKIHCRNSYRAACQAIRKKPGLCFLRPQHICSPMLKSKCEELYGRLGKQINDSVTRVRSNDNLNQYLYLDYIYLRGKIINKRQSKKHFSLGVASVKNLCQFILHPTHKLACINDVQLSEERYVVLRSAILEAFEARFPDKSKFEL